MIAPLNQLSQRPFLRAGAAALLAALALLAGCHPEQPAAPVDRDWSAIQARDTLVALTAYNSTSYFLYRGEPMGYEYRLLKAFAEDHDLALRMRVVPGRDSIYQLLNAGAGDLVAARVVRSAADTARIAFTEALHTTPPVLVQQEQAASAVDSPAVLDTLLEGRAQASSSTPLQVRARLVQRPPQLAGKRVTLPRRSAYRGTLAELSDSLSGEITVVELDTAATAEAVIRMVAGGDVRYTVSPQNLARLKESYFTNISIEPVVGAPRKVVWAVRKNAPALRDTLSAWIRSQQGTAFFNQTYRTYFVDRQGYRERETSPYLTGETGTLSAYDALLKRGAQALGWDWRLLASQAYEESRFRPRAESWAGARGLFQLMPATARAHDVADAYDPADNVAGAVRFLDWLSDYWTSRIADTEERRKFILASYNAGHGHVEDARRLAAKHGHDDTAWESVAYWLLQKSKRAVYEDPVVRYGFCRGLEPVTYVARILKRYEHYQEFAGSSPERDGAAS